MTFAPKSGKACKKGEVKEPVKPKGKRGAPIGNKNAVGNAGGGRPALYKPEYAEMARKIALLGATEQDLAGIFGVGDTTISDWKKNYIEFSDAFEKGKLLADAEVAASLYKRATGYEQDAVKIFMPSGFPEPVYAPYREHYPPDTGAAAFWLKNRRRMNWRDKQELEHTGKDGAPLTTETTVIVLPSNSRDTVNEQAG
jgi:hypothetical protein